MLASTAATLLLAPQLPSILSTGHLMAHGQARPNAAHALSSLATAREARMAFLVPPRALVAL